MAMNFFDAAADLVSLGFKVFPLVPGNKLPLIKAWQRAATDDADVIAAWMARCPNANVGVVTGETSSVVVVDLDVKDDRNGLQDLETLRARGKVLPPCPIALTPSGGRHLYFRAVSGLKNVVGLTTGGRGLGQGIDVRAAGGFVVAPPSELASGRYRWLVPPMTPAFPRLPDWAVKMLLPPPLQPAPAFHTAAKGGDIEHLARFVASSSKGERNNRLHWAACRAGELVARRVVSEAAAARRLTEAAAAVGLIGHEVFATIRSGLHRTAVAAEGIRHG